VEFYLESVFVVEEGNSSGAVLPFGNPEEVEPVSEPLLLLGEKGS